MKQITKYLTQNPYFNDGKWIEGGALRGFFLHSVGVGQPDPLVFWRSWNNPNFTNAGVSGFIGADEVYLTAPCLEQAGRVKRMPHAGKPAGNNGYIGFEMCEPASIRYTSGAKFTCADVPAARAFANKTYQNAVELFAQLCRLHGKDPLADGVIVSHAEGYRRGIATNHADPEHLWKGLGLALTMDGFRRDVADALAQKGEINMTKQEVEALIDARVRLALSGGGKPASDWAKEDLEAAKTAGITDGTAPRGYATREQVVSMILRAMK